MSDPTPLMDDELEKLESAAVQLQDACHADAIQYNAPPGVQWLLDLAELAPVLAVPAAGAQDVQAFLVRE